MLYALSEPASFVLLLVSYLLCVTLSGWITSLVAARRGHGALRAEGRTRPDPRRQVDPFSAVSAAIAGFGWSKPVDAPRTSAGQVALVVLSGPVVLLVAGLGALAGFGARYGQGLGNGGLGDVLDALGGSNVLQRGFSAYLVGGYDLGPEAWLLLGLMATYVGFLSLLPLPPLPGGQVLFAAAPRTLGWQKAEYQLVERNFGTLALLLLMLLPLGGSAALLPYLLNEVLGPLIGVVAP